MARPVLRRRSAPLWHVAALVTAVGLTASAHAARGRAVHAAPTAVTPTAPAPPPRHPVASASAIAVRVLLPSARGASTPVAALTAPSVVAGSYAYPGDGSVVISGAVRATSTAKLGARASAHAESAVVNLSLFDGEITAASVAVSVAASANPLAAGAHRAPVVLTRLQVEGRSPTHGRVVLPWGTLTIGAGQLVRAAPQGVGQIAAALSGLVLRLTKPHGGLPAGSEIEIASAWAHAATAQRPPTLAELGPIPGDRPQLLPPTTGPLIGVPQVIEPPLGPGPYVFPVYGQADYEDTFGSSQGGDYDHGDPIFGELGEPLVAVADGTLFAVGWSRGGGNRLWLRDSAGDEFYYGGLSAFAAAAVNGAHVRSGEVIGFMGQGGAQAGATHLEFELHPESLLFLGSQGAVDPAPYLATWRQVDAITVPAGAAWAPLVPGTLPAPEPGAVLVGSSDISSAGQGAAALRRAVEPAG